MEGGLTRNEETLLQAGKADLVRAAPSDDIGELLGRIGRSEALLALPDSAVYNPENVRSILLATYR